MGKLTIMAPRQPAPLSADPGATVSLGGASSVSRPRGDEALQGARTTAAKFTAPPPASDLEAPRYIKGADPNKGLPLNKQDIRYIKSPPSQDLPPPQGLPNSLIEKAAQHYMPLVQKTLDEWRGELAALREDYSAVACNKGLFPDKRFDKALTPSQLEDIVKRVLGDRKIPPDAEAEVIRLELLAAKVEAKAGYVLAAEKWHGHEKTWPHISFPGGGAKGAVYPAVMSVYADAIRSAEKISGSSAGSICAAFAAAGLSSEGVTKILDQYSMGDFTGDAKLPPIKDLEFLKTSSTKAYLLGQGTNLAQGLTRKAARSDGSQPELYCNGEKLIAVVNQECLANVSEVLTHTPDLDAIAKRKSLSTSQYERLTALREGRAEMLTFGDMNLLHQLEPRAFKELNITGTVVGQDQTVHFNHRTFPEMPIALAVRISSSIDPVFGNVRYRGVEYHDGGLSNNNPMNPSESSPQNTLMFSFASAGRAEKNIFGPDPGTVSSQSEASKPLAKKLESWMKDGIYRHDGDRVGRRDGSLAWNQGPNSRIIQHGHIDSADFDTSKLDVIKARLEARIYAAQERINYLG
ncbi:patatin-like phospholipase family protein [Ideonella sp.]|jgi:predicted acylesterase/phospholipase RssA|uniref:patatin-like phospholipase family protein n=1 Tax=Ideonella sp. TaxID=1929293 RepID=UPI0037C14FCB